MYNFYLKDVINSRVKNMTYRKKNINSIKVFEQKKQLLIN